MCKVYSECCKNCLLSKDRIVSAKRAKEIIKDVKKNQSYFVCHKATMEGKEIVCKTFYDTMGFYSQLIRIGQRLGAIEFVDQPESEKLIPHNQTIRKLQ